MINLNEPINLFISYSIIFGPRPHMTNKKLAEIRNEITYVLLLKYDLSYVRGAFPIRFEMIV